jgi:hypothetical protein
MPAERRRRKGFDPALSIRQQFIQADSLDVHHNAHRRPVAPLPLGRGTSLRPVPHLAAVSAGEAVVQSVPGTAAPKRKEIARCHPVFLD